MTSLLLIPFFLCWGSFLNVIAYRLMFHEISFFSPRSHCPYCKQIIAWYDNIPVLSWLLLLGKCRHCKKTISWLYPFIELLTAVSFWLLIERIHPIYLPAYTLFFSALIISIRTDLETLLISRFVTLWLIPLGFIFSYYGLLPISLQQSIFGAISAFVCLFTIAQVYYLLTKKVGMGQGDVELLAFIGSFIGIIGWWMSLLIASCTGTLIGIGIAFLHKKSFVGVKIPFGPFLAFGAILYVLFQSKIVSLFIGI